MAGPLNGIRIIEIAGIGPGPFCAMMLADHGAEVIRVERPVEPNAPFPKNASMDPLERSRMSIVVDMKRPEGIQIVRDLAKTADGLLEGFRPGVMERLGLGPDILLEDNAALVYGRITGWGQFGPYAQTAGHDINYIALAGALHAYGREGEKPTPPVNVVGDFGGGGMMLAFGMVSAILAARASGRGQVIDCAMTDGTAVLMAQLWGLHAQGFWRDERGTNALDTGAHFYDTYECADGGYISIGSIEPRFYAELRRLTGLDEDPAFDAQMDPRQWRSLKEKLASMFRTRTRDQWCAIMEYTDVCFSPVLSMAEAPSHPHNVARGTFATIEGVPQPMPAPRYSLTPTDLPRAPVRSDADSKMLLAKLGYSPAQIADLQKTGVIA
ncbi:MAG TPA: CaiB/BaiF CoA-transferase family protein [Sphingobium sp.]